MDDFMDFDWPNAPSGLANLIQPPTKPRKPKARTLRDSDWEPCRKRFTELYTSGMTLKDLKHHIEVEFEFFAEARQYKSRVQKWKLNKNVKSKEMKAIVRKRQQRILQEPCRPELVFHVRGQEVEQAKIERWMHDRGVSESALFVPSPAASTPSVIEWRTNSEPGTPASRSCTPFPIFDDLLPNSYNEAPLDRSSSRSRSLTPTPGEPMSPPTRVPLPSIDCHINGGPVVDINFDRMPWAHLYTFDRVLYSWPNLHRPLDSVRYHWRDLFHLTQSDLSQFEAQLAHCKNVTDRYIQESPDWYIARAVLVMAEYENWILPRNEDTTRLRSILEYWISIGYDMNGKNTYGSTILLQVCESYYEDVSRDQVTTPESYLSLLIEHGANVHSTDRSRRGALHLFMNTMGERLFRVLTIRKVEEILVVLLQAGCDPHSEDIEGKTPTANVPLGRSFITRVPVPGETAHAAWHRAMARTRELRRARALERASREEHEEQNVQALISPAWIVYRDS